ncbi:heme ABC transporter ATP-binding protein [Vibrio maerlii]|uniref:heme ABC transporter ATP-binding protein n=1 Tax=Vibrio maerlii TaxID=2231648 RepID=UPI000E3E5531|nr:heme ABC transporter ATP-binding protein [Vibrio maerlii]
MTSPSTNTSQQYVAAIKAENLNINFGSRQLLKNVDIEIKSGEVTSLLGPNGAGKSTLLKLLSGEIESESKIEYFGQSKDSWKKSQLAKHVGILPQHSTLTFPFLAEEVVELGAIPLNLPSKQLKALAKENMAFAEVEHLHDRLYPSLSGGEKQRVHLARVLTQLSHAGDQCVLMLDEPTSALDLAHQHNTLKLAQKMAKNHNAAVIVVLHDLNLASQYSDRLVMLSDGSLVADGKPDDVLSSEIIEQVYGYQSLIAPHPTLGFPMVHAAA